MANLDGREVNTFTAADFEPHLGKKFAVVLEGYHPIEMELAHVESLQHIEEVREVPGVSLLFWHETPKFGVQAYHTYHHPDAGTFSGFTVPISPMSLRSKKGQGTVFQVIFN